MIRTAKEIRGKASDVVKEIAETYPDIAAMTYEILIAMQVTKTDKIEVTADMYKQVGDCEISVGTDGDKIYIEILKEEDSETTST